MFQSRINHRTHLITNSTESNELKQQIFEIAKRNFPNWIGFKKDRCSYDELLSERIGRIRAVSNWKIDKAFKETED